jgi:hypothetical protein
MTAGNVNCKRIRREAKMIPNGEKRTMPMMPTARHRNGVLARADGAICCNPSHDTASDTRKDEWR